MAKMAKTEEKTKIPPLAPASSPAPCRAPGSEPVHGQRLSLLLGTWLFLGALILNACSPAGIAMTGLATNTIDYIETGKTLPDRVLSNIYQKDCAFKYYEDIKKFCKGTEYGKVEPIYCYKTRGSAQCYTNAPQFYAGIQPLGGLERQREQEELHREYLRRQQLLIQRREALEKGEEWDDSLMGTGKLIPDQEHTGIKETPIGGPSGLSAPATPTIQTKKNLPAPILFDEEMEAVPVAPVNPAPLSNPDQKGALEGVDQG